MTDVADLEWNDARDLLLSGLGWPASALAKPFDRLPAKAEGVVRPEVWFLACQAAGIYVDFVTDAPEIRVRWTVEGDHGGTDLEAQVAWSGVDCYGQDVTGQWCWVGNRAIDSYPEGCGKVHANELDGEERRYRVYAPLRNRLTRFEIGVSASRTIKPAAARNRPPIIYYGTSIVHGAGVGRPGMAHASQLGRLLGRQVINLGFAGNGRMEPEVARLLGELDGACFLLDCLPNIPVEQVEDRVVEFIQQLDAARPNTPKVLIGDRLFGDAAFITGRREIQQDKNAAQRRALEQLVEMDVNNLHLLEDDNWFGDHQDGTCDGSHPNDLGAFEQANALCGRLAKVLVGGKECLMR